MKILVPRQTKSGETRVSLTPTAAKRLIELGTDVDVQGGCGTGSHHGDDAYETVGATVTPSHDDAALDLWSHADLVVTIHPPSLDQIQSLRSSATLIGMFDPFRNHDAVQALASQRVTAFSMELLPRISRAQPMDVLSSQANIAGYQAVILAAEACPKIFPMMITAAGTIAPARVMVIGAGVAGLQAIATAKRLGAVVEAYDIRPEVEEQIQSLGARFIKLPAAKKDAATEGGYAKEQTAEERKQQAELMAKHVVSADAVITTAALFGKAPPMLIPADVVHRKEAGTVLVDLAADEQSGRGNCELTEPGKRITTERGVTVEGHTNLPSLSPVHSSQMYAHNMFSFLKEIIVDGQVRLNTDDELQRGPLLTHEGDIMHDMVKKVIEGNGGR